jgi:hypothetical protein
MSGRKVRPELESRHDPFPITLRHLLMDDAASRGHPLHVTRADDASVPKAVSMFYLALEDIGNRLDASMGMPRKSLEVVIGIVRPKIVEKEERVKLRHLGVTKRPFQTDPCSLDGGSAFPGFFYSSITAHLYSLLFCLHPLTCCLGLIFIFLGFSALHCAIPKYLQFYNFRIITSWPFIKATKYQASSSEHGISFLICHEHIRPVQNTVFSLIKYMIHFIYFCIINAEK